MNNETGNEKKTLLVLVPHRDARLKALKYKDTLNLTDGYHFPCVAPLASITKPLTNEELKKTAKLLRKVLGTEMIKASETASVKFYISEEKTILTGFNLKIKIPHEAFDDIYKNILNIFSPAVIGTFLTEQFLKNYKQNDNLPEISFRAAALANMHWLPVKIKGEMAYKWKIGKLFWLPKKAPL